MRRFGEFLVEEEYVTPKQLDEGLQKQVELRRKPIGELLVDMGALTQEQLEHSLTKHLDQICAEGTKRQFFGEFLIEEGLIQRSDLERALYEQSRYRRLRIGEILVDLGHISDKKLHDAVQAQLTDLAVG